MPYGASSTAFLFLSDFLFAGRGWILPAMPARSSTGGSQRLRCFLLLWGVLGVWSLPAGTERRQALPLLAAFLLAQGFARRACTRRCRKRWTGMHGNQAGMNTNAFLRPFTTSGVDWTVPV